MFPPPSDLKVGDGTKQKEMKDETKPEVETKPEEVETEPQVCCIFEQIIKL